MGRRPNQLSGRRRNHDPSGLVAALKESPKASMEELQHSVLSAAHPHQPRWTEIVASLMRLTDKLTCLPRRDQPAPFRRVISGGPNTISPIIMAVTEITRTPAAAASNA